GAARGTWPAAPARMRRAREIRRSMSLRSSKDPAAPVAHDAGDLLGLVLLDEVDALARGDDFEGGEVLLAPTDSGLAHDGTRPEGQQQLGLISGGRRPLAAALDDA